MSAGAVDRTCAACGERVATDPCPRCGASTLLDGRYVLLDVLGKGAQATTWLAETSEGQRVAVKELRVDGDDKARELVTREARVLKQIAVRDVPRYVDDFATASGRQRLVCVVQEYVEGPTLEAWSRDRRLTVAEGVALVDALLGILAELHQLSPPVIHRDVKPANVILRDGSRVTLVDFGSVRDVWKGTLGGSTVTGTFGYMPPEQFAGDASPASDVYAAAVVLVALLSRKEPAALLGVDRAIAWRPHVQVDAALGRWLDRCLDADPARRPANAAIAREELAAARSTPARAPSPPEAPNAAHTRLSAAPEAGPRVYAATRQPVVDPLPRLPAKLGGATPQRPDPVVEKQHRTLAVAGMLSLVMVALVSVLGLGASLLVARAPSLLAPDANGTPTEQERRVVEAVATTYAACVQPGDAVTLATKVEGAGRLTVVSNDVTTGRCMTQALADTRVNVSTPYHLEHRMAKTLREGDADVARDHTYRGETFDLRVEAPPGTQVSLGTAGAKVDGAGTFTVEDLPRGVYRLYEGETWQEFGLDGASCTLALADGTWTRTCR